MIGRVVGHKYSILRQLGEGGMGVVYEALDNRTGRRVAIKVLVNRGLTTDREARLRFEREALAARAIDTPHIVGVVDAGVDRDLDQPFLVMELMSGADLEQLVQHLAPLPPDLALRIAAQACLGLARAHQTGIVHRDIKPANLYLARQGTGEVVVKIADFGIAKLSVDQLGGGQDHALTQAGSLLGSPLFMSPEQARGLPVDHRTDLWSLGAVMYQALTGRAPHHGIDSVGQLLITICSVPAPPLQDLAPWVHPQIAAIVHRALSIDAGERFSSAGEMLGAILPFLPDGSMLNEWMLAPLSDEVRSSIAPRLDAGAKESSGPASTTPASGWPASRVHPSGAAPQIKDVDRTQEALTRTAGSARSSTVPLAIAAMLVVGGALVWRILPMRPAEPPATTSVGGPSPPAALPEPHEILPANPTGPIVTPVSSSAAASKPPVLPPPTGGHRRAAPIVDKNTPQIAHPDPDNLGTRRLIRRSLE